MFDSAGELLDKIRLGEDTSLELKRVEVRGARVVAPSRDDLADELAAMANTSDGVLVLGVDDRTREILGIALADLDAAEALVREVCNDTIHPPLLVHIRKMELPDSLGTPHAILRVDVPRSLFVHNSRGRYFHRVGSSKREMQPEMLARLFQQRSQARILRFDEQTVPDSTFADLEPALWQRLCDPNAEDPVLTLRKRKVLAMDEGVERATVTGVLLCSTHPERWLPGASARAVRFRGVHQDSNFQVDAADITGPLDQQILGLYSFTLRNMQHFVPAARPEVSQYSRRAVFEAIVNAVAHRDYSIYGSRIRMFLFDDRLELYSPGPLPNTLSVESIALRQSTRNEAVKSILVKLPVGETGAGSGRGFFMEAQGDGVPIIQRDTLALTGRPAVWRMIDDSEVLLTIPAAHAPAAAGDDGDAPDPEGAPDDVSFGR